MIYNSKKIYGNREPKTVQDLINEALPEYGWLIDEEINYVNHLNGYNSIIEDLEFAKDCLSELSKIRIDERKTGNPKSRLIKRAFFTNSIITYARCFNYTKKNGRISISHNEFKKEFPENVNITADDLINFHNYIMDLRNKFIAHADQNVFETNRAYIEFKFEDMYLKSTFANLSVSMFSFDETQLINFMKLIEFLMINLENKKKLLTEKVKNEIGNEKLLGLASKIVKND